MSDERQDPPPTGRPLRTEAGFTDVNQPQKSKKENKQPKP